jgi:hypothetical protein
VLGHGEKRREVGRGPVKPEVGAHPFIGAGEGHAGARKGETAGGNGLNAIEGKRLNEGLRGGGGIKRGDPGGERRPCLVSRCWTPGGAGWPEATRRSGTVSEIGRHGEGDEADRQGPHGSDVRERRCLCRNAQSRRKYTFRQIRQGCLGRMG